jgi:hypothetical protein
MKVFELLLASRMTKSAIICTVMLLVTTFLEAREVSVYLTSQRFGQGQAIQVDSGDRKIPAAAEYSYNLTGKIRGEIGKPTSQLIKGKVDIAEFLESLSPGASGFLSGTFSNPGGTLPLTILDKQFSGARNVKGFGRVAVSFKVVGKILVDGQCVFEVTDVKLKSNPKKKLGSILFAKGSIFSISASP